MAWQRARSLRGAVLASAVALAAAGCGGDAGLAPLNAVDKAPSVATERVGRYAAGPTDQQFDAVEHRYFATLETTKGEIEFELWPALAPQNVNAFVFLARAGFYDGLTFHRVIADFVIQGGDPAGTGLGGPGFGLSPELHADDPVPMGPGAVAMARIASLPESAGSQFFIVTGDGPPVQNLTGLYTVIGWVTKGLDAAKAVVQGDVMAHVTVTARGAGAGVVTPDEVRAGLVPAQP